MDLSVRYHFQLLNRLRLPLLLRHLALVARDQRDELGCKTHLTCIILADALDDVRDHRRARDDPIGLRRNGSGVLEPHARRQFDLQLRLAEVGLWNERRGYRCERGNR